MRNNDRVITCSYVDTTDSEYATENFFLLLFFNNHAGENEGENSPNLDYILMEQLI